MVCVIQNEQTHEVRMGPTDWEVAAANGCRQIRDWLIIPRDQ